MEGWDGDQASTEALRDPEVPGDAPQATRDARGARRSRRQTAIGSSCVSCGALGEPPRCERTSERAARSDVHAYRRARASPRRCGQSRRCSGRPPAVPNAPRGRARDRCACSGGERGRRSSRRSRSGKLGTFDVLVGLLFLLVRAPATPTASSPPCTRAEPRAGCCTRCLRSFRARAPPLRRSFPPRRP